MLGLAGCHQKQPEQTVGQPKQTVQKPKEPIQQPKHQPIDSLRDALQRAAVSSFPTPSLTNAHIDFAVKIEEIDSKSEQIATLVKELKGTVFSEPASASGQRLLITLPGDKVAEFAKRAGVPDKSLSTADNSELSASPNNASNLMIEVRITPEAQ